MAESIQLTFGTAAALGLSYSVVEEKSMSANIDYFLLELSSEKNFATARQPLQVMST